MKQSAWLALAVLATLWLVVAILIDVATNTIAEIAVQGGWAPVGKAQLINDPEHSNNTAGDDEKAKKPDTHPGEPPVPAAAIEDRKTDREDRLRSP
jgi:hypothetical protein